jgi:cytoskeletal protein RodZ
MQHLDDALIAEWVDGAVPSNSPQHAAIAAHVEQCDECRARVDEERALAGHVRQLLGVAAPPERIPPFEEVLHRAGAMPKSAPSPRFPWRRLAWAATVVVAGGVGWYARGLLIQSGAERGAVPAQTTSRETSELDDTAAPSSVPTQPAPVLEEAPAVGGVAARQEAAPAPGRDAAAAEPQDAAAKRLQAVHLEVADEQVAARRDAAPPAAPAAAEPRAFGQVSAPAENELRMQKAATESWIGTTRSEAERVLGHPLLLVEGLAVTGVQLAADSGAVRVRQSLAGGGTLELVLSRAAPPEPVVADAVAGAAAEPRERLARNAPPTVESVVDGVRVVLSGPVSPDSLRALLARLR